MSSCQSLLGNAMEYFKGGAFSCGAQLMLWEGQADNQGLFEKIYELNGDAFLSWLKDISKESTAYRVKRYEKEKQLYKCTIQFPTEKRALEFAERYRQISEQWSETRMFVENKCVQFVARSANKAAGVGVLCEKLGISFDDIAFCGHDKEDEELLERCYAVNCKYQ